MILSVHALRVIRLVRVGGVLQWRLRDLLCWVVFHGEIAGPRSEARSYSEQVPREDR